MNGVISNGFAPRVLLDRRQRHLGELHVAGRAPRQHLPGLALRELVERVLGEAAGGRRCRRCATARCRSNGSGRP